MDDPSDKTAYSVIDSQTISCVTLGGRCQKDPAILLAIESDSSWPTVGLLILL